MINTVYLEVARVTALAGPGFVDSESADCQMSRTRCPTLNGLLSESSEVRLFLSYRFI